MKHLKIFFENLGRILVYLIVPSLVFELLLLLPFTPSRESLPEGIYVFVLDIFIITGVYFMFGYYDKNITDVVFKSKLQVKKIVQLLPISLLSRIPIVIILLILSLVFGDVISDTINKGVEFQWFAFDSSSLESAFIGFMTYVVFPPIHEELFFRGVIQRNLSKTYSARTSIILTAIVFGLIHVHPGLIGSTFILGLFLGYIYYKWGNLWYSMILHVFINLLPFFLQILSLKTK